MKVLAIFLGGALMCSCAQSGFRLRGEVRTEYGAIIVDDKGGVTLVVEPLRDK